MTTILLSKKGNTEFYLSGISHAQLEILKECHRIKDYLRFNAATEIDGEGVIRVGHKDNAKPINISSYVTHLKGYAPSLSRTNERKVQFRCYEYKEETQLINAHVVSICPDRISSAKSALRMIKEPCLVLWNKENL